MTVTIDIPDDCLAHYRKQAEARGLTLDQWLLQLAEEHAPRPRDRKRAKPSLAEVFAKVRGLADDLDLSRDPSPGRDVDLQ